jgi:hypothetical protein
MALLVVRCEPPTGYLRTRCSRKYARHTSVGKVQGEQKTRLTSYCLMFAAGGVPNCCDAFRILSAITGATKGVYHTTFSLSNRVVQALQQIEMIGPRAQSLPLCGNTEIIAQHICAVKSTRAGAVPPAPPPLAAAPASPYSRTPSLAAPAAAPRTPAGRQPTRSPALVRRSVRKVPGG